MRENVKSIGLILALIIAGVSLPTSIISIMNKPKEEQKEEQNFYTITAYDLGVYDSVIINISMKEDDVFSYSFTQAVDGRKYVYIFALSCIDGYDIFGDGHYPNSTEWDYLNKCCLERSEFGSGYYKVNSTGIWSFLLFQASGWIEYLTITYTIFN